CSPPRLRNSTTPRLRGRSQTTTLPTPPKADHFHPPGVGNRDDSPDRKHARHREPRGRTRPPPECPWDLPRARVAGGRNRMGLAETARANCRSTLLASLRVVPSGTGRADA